ncbi:MAG: hypothetical protein ACLTHQ_15280 [Odoribacter splanchnicus]
MPNIKIRISITRYSRKRRQRKTLKAMKEDGVTWPQILNTGKVAMEAYG